MAPMFERASGLFHGVQRTMLRFGTWILAAWLTVLAGSAAWAERVTLYAAASLRTALDTLAPELEAATGYDLRIAYGGSSKLARQIEQGAPADIFISANKEWIEYLLTGNRIIAASGVDLLSNRLVLIGQRGALQISLQEVGSFGTERIAIGLTQAVPAGIYGREALETLGLWEPLKAQLVETDNVRAALALVARGEARFGIVYASDAVAEPAVQVLASFPPDTHSPIVYPAVVVSGSKAGAEVLAFLQSKAAWAVFEAQGFLPVEGNGE